MFLDLNDPPYGRFAVLTALDKNRMNLVQRAYCGRHPETIFTSEPSVTFIHVEILGLQRSADWDKLCSAAKLKIYQVGRDQHVADVIVPARKAGKNVVSERFDIDSWARQFWGEEWHEARVKSIFL